MAYILAIMGMYKESYTPCITMYARVFILMHNTSTAYIITITIQDHGMQIVMI